jgi:glucan-binding YG repeat protein
MNILTADQDYMPLTSTEAKRLGLSMYFTGKPCKNNHVTSRYASSKECFFCRKDKNANPVIKEQQKQWAANNYENISMLGKQRYERNKSWEQLRGQAKWVINKEKVLKTNKAWSKNNPEKMRLLIRNRNKLRKLIVKQQRPKWADLQKIRQIYDNCPDGFHVDHIVPLRGKTVCGFHIETNLQYLPALENIKKSNNFVFTE